MQPLKINTIRNTTELNTLKTLGYRDKKKEYAITNILSFSSGGRTRTYDLRVMSPTSYQLLHSALLWGKYRVVALTAQPLVHQSQ